MGYTSLIQVVSLLSQVILSLVAAYFYDPFSDLFPRSFIFYS